MRGLGGHADLDSSSLYQITAHPSMMHAMIRVERSLIVRLLHNIRRLILFTLSEVCLTDVKIYRVTIVT